MKNFTFLFKKLFRKEDKEMQNLARFMPGFISPNLLSFLRLLLLLPIILMIKNDQYGLAALLFLVAYFLDILDGALARVKNKITKFGKLFDPLVDKIVFLAVLFLLAKERIPNFLLYLILSLELFIVFLVIISHPLAYFLKLEVKMGANVFGKIKMFLQTLGTIILFFLVSTNRNIYLATVVFGAAIFFSALSILKHLLSIRKIKR